MQPTVPQVIETLEFSLRHDLIPELQTDWAKQIGERMLWALNHLKQRALHEHALAVEENRQLKALLRLAGEQGAVDTRSLPLAEQHWPDLPELLQQNDALRSVVDLFIQGSAEEDIASPAHPVWKELLVYLQHQTERETQLAAGDWPPKADGAEPAVPWPDKVVKG